MICIPCHNRRRIVEQCIPTVVAGMEEGDELHLYNDASEEYEVEFLRQFRPTLVSVVASPIGIERQRKKHFLGFEPDKFTHLYLTDSDALHDPKWRRHALMLQASCTGAPVCLYDTAAHERLIGNTVSYRPGSGVIWRRVAPGISYLLTAEHVARVVRALPMMPDHWNWDWTVPTILGNCFAISEVSHVDHIGLGGMHHPAGEGLDGGDRALNPTPWLVQKRAEVVAKLNAA